MKTKRLSLYCTSVLFFLLHFTTLSAQDSTITISKARNTYEFVKTKEGKVVVKEAKQTQYLNKSSTELLLSEFYNDNATITEFNCRVNNKSVKDFSPINTFYSVKDIFYSDARINYYPLQLAPKSIVDVTIEKTTNNPIYFTSIYFNSNYAIAQKEISVKIPRSMNVELKELNFEGNKIEKTISYLQKEDADLITYKAINLLAIADEKYSPGNSYIYPHLFMLSKSNTAENQSVYFGSTKDQYQWYSKLVEDVNDEKNPAVVQQVNEITKGITSDLEKIKAIFYWVQENIRYIAFEDGLAGFKPDHATEVLRKKYGDCKGMANLTKTLLKVAGYDARLCWIGTNHIAYNYATPSLAVDNHMICALKFQNQTYYLDATETYLGFNEYAERIQGRQVLIEDGKNFQLSNVPTTNVKMNQDFQKKILSINGKDLVGTVEHNWKGEEKEVLLSSINSVKKDALQKQLISYLSNGNQNYMISDLELSDLKNYDKDVNARFKLNLKNGVEQFDDAYYFSLDVDKEYNNFIIDTIKRKTDVWLPYKTHVVKEVELKVPSNYIVSDKPDNLDIKNENYEFQISYEAKDDKIYYKKSIQILNPKIRKQLFSTWNNDIKKLSQQYSETIILKPKS